MAAGSIKLTVQASKFGSAQTDFPVVFNASLSSGTNAFSWVDFFSEMSDADRWKVKIYLSDHTTELKAEVELGYDFASSKVVYHVKADSIEDGDIFYLDYDSTFADNTTYIGDTEDTPALAVWDSGFKLVQLMADVTTAFVPDSTDNVNFSTKKAANLPIEADWSVGKCQNFSNTDYMRVTDSDDFYFGTGDLSIEFMVNFTALPTSGNRIYFCGQTNGVSVSWGLTLYNNSGTLQWEFFAYNAGYTFQMLRNAISLVTGTEYYFAVTRNGTTFTMHQDVSQVGATYSSSGALDNISRYLEIGNASGSNFLNGKLRALKITKGAYRTSDWLIATRYSLDDDIFAMEDDVSQVATPVITPTSGAYPSSQLITITCATIGADIYYTEDGSTPDATDTLYTVPFTLSVAKTIKAIGIDGVLADSDIASETYTVTVPTVDTPVVVPSSGAYPTTDTITITSGTAEALLYYTVDGSVPDATDILYTGPISMFAGTLKVVGIADGYLDSSVVTEIYTIAQVATPEADPLTGSYTYLETIELSTLTVGASIYYTLDGTTPTAASTLYTAPIPMFKGTLKIIGIKAGYIDSSIVTYLYSILEDNVYCVAPDAIPYCISPTTDPFCVSSMPDPYCVAPLPDCCEIIACPCVPIECSCGSLVCDCDFIPDPSPLPLGEWVASVSELAKKYIYVYDKDNYAVLKIDVSGTNPKVVDWLVINDADYVLDYAMGYGTSGGQRGGYCISKSDGILWYLFRNIVTGSVKVVSVNITDTFMTIRKSTIHTGILNTVGGDDYDGATEFINDAAGTDSYVFFPTNKFSLRVLRFDSAHNLIEKDWGLSNQTWAESIHTCDIDLFAKRINFVHTRDPFVTIYFKSTDFLFLNEINQTELEAGIDSGQWQNLYRWDDIYNFHFHHRAFWPGNGIIWRGGAFGTPGPRHWIQDQQYVQSYMGSDVDYYYFQMHTNAVNDFRLVRATKIDPITSQAEPTTYIDARPYNGYNDYGTLHTKSMSTFNRLQRKSCLFKYNAATKINYLSTFNFSLALISTYAPDTIYWGE